MEIDAAEFRHIIETHIALSACDSVLTLIEEKSRHQDTIIVRREEEIAAHKKHVDFLRAELDAQKPGWLDHFLPGFIVGTIVVASGLALAR